MERLMYFAIILPGMPMLNVWSRPPVGLNIALGLEVCTRFEDNSLLYEPFSSGSFRLCILTCFNGRVAFFGVVYDF